MLDQGELIEEFFSGEGEKTLILLDACRYDYFEKLYPNYLEGELTKCHNQGVSWTYSWFSKFCRDMNDVTLLTAAPVAVHKWKEKEGGDYDPEEHFKEIPNWSEYDWDFEEGTATPFKINEVVRRKPARKRLVRYLKPHPPFIGTPLEDITKGSGKIQRTEKALIEGEITEQDLRNAYEKNVRIAFEGAVDLIPDLDGNAVITSDHGTALNENSYLFHAQSYPEMPCLNHVPWFDVEDTLE